MKSLPAHSGSDGSPPLGDMIPPGEPWLMLRFGVTDAPGQFIIDSACFGNEGVRMAERYISAEAFNAAPPSREFTCLSASRNDINCDCRVDVIDLVSMIDVIVRGKDPSAITCDACVNTCR